MNIEFQPWAYFVHFNIFCVVVLLKWIIWALPYIFTISKWNNQITKYNIVESAPKHHQQTFW